MTNKERLENYVVNKAQEKRANENFMDERQQLKTAKMFMASAVCAMLFDCIMMAVYVIKRDADKAYPYLAQLLVISVVFCIAALGQKEPGLPTTLSGRSVDPEKSGAAFAKRLLGYFVEAAFVLAAITALNVYVDGKVTGSIVSDTIITFVIFMLIEAGIGELRVHRWRSWQQKLDEEENSLED